MGLESQTDGLPRSDSRQPGSRRKHLMTFALGNTRATLNHCHPDCIAVESLIILIHNVAILFQSIFQSNLLHQRKETRGRKPKTVYFRRRDIPFCKERACFYYFIFSDLLQMHMSGLRSRANVVGTQHDSKSILLRDWAPPHSSQTDIDWSEDGTWFTIDYI